MVFGKKELKNIQVREDRMKKYFKLYFNLVRFALMKNMAYPQDFFIWTIVDLTWTMVNLGFFKVLLLRMPNISGWTFNQLVLILGFVEIVSALVWGLMYANMKQLVRDINKGSLDLYLTKPVNSQFLVSSKEMSFNVFPKLFTGFFLVSYGLSINGFFGLPSLLIVVLSAISSTLIVYSMYFISVTTALFLGRLSNVAELLPHSLDVAKYPTNIFPPFIQFLFTFIVPFALLGFIPSKIIFGSISPWYILVLPASAFVLLMLSGKFWNKALRSYTSASS
jgi:ABC-2 type transport system permease protein